MSIANPVTKLGQMELARLVHEYLDNHPGLIPSATVISQRVADHRTYGHFRDLALIDKIRSRRRRRSRPRVTTGLSPLVDRLRRWRAKRVVRVFNTIFRVVPAGGASFSIRWKLGNDYFGSSTSREGYYNQRVTSLSVNMRMHPHWHRRLSAVCLKMNRFFVEITDLPAKANGLKVFLWGLEVRKGRGYTFKCGWVPFTSKEIKENALDRLEPWQTVGLLGLDGLADPLPTVSRAAAVAGQ